MLLIFLSLGSNLGDRETFLAQAREQLSHRGTITRTSSLYLTEPLHIHDQPWFLNQVIALETSLEPQALLKETQRIENELGRERTIRFGPRTIDIDLLLSGSTVLDTNNLILPHPRLHERRFVLQPLNEIAQEILHPIYKISIQELLQTCPDQSEVKLYQKP